MIPYGRQSISEVDIAAVVDVLRSDFLTQGPAVPAFENAVASHCGVRYVVAVNSATSALHLACLALGVGCGDIVWTSPITFVASANCARYCGADVDFVDIDPLTFNMCPQKLRQKLEDAAEKRCLPKVVIPVHLCGQPPAMKEIHALSQEFGFQIIEDASHAIGARYLGEPVGNCRFSDITVFSFHPVKIITTGEGGMALTNNEHLAARMNRLRTHGITRDPQEMEGEAEEPWYYQQVELGWNYRMTDIQAALGLSQLTRLDDFVDRRHAIAKKYALELNGLALSLPWQHPDGYSAYHLYVIRLKLEVLSRSRKEIFEGLRSARIGVNIHYIPVHLQPYYQRMGFQSGQFPESEKYYAEAISLPMFPDLKGEQQDRIVKTLSGLLQN